MTEYALPAPALHGPGLTDVRMMVVAHGPFRRELGLSPRAVRSVAPGDHRRTTAIADHVELFLDLLHHHHTIEDDLLWDRLLARVPEELAPLVHTMEDQHEAISDELLKTATALARWRSSSSADDAAALASTLERLTAALGEHLDAEEAQLLPIMARQITASEWDEFTRQGMDAIPKNRRILGFGVMLYEGDREVIALQLREVPAPMRPILPFLGRRAYRRYARRIHGTGTPPTGRELHDAPAGPEAEPDRGRRQQ